MCCFLWYHIIAIIIINNELYISILSPPHQCLSCIYGGRSISEILWTMQNHMFLLSFLLIIFCICLFNQLLLILIDSSLSANNLHLFMYTLFSLFPPSFPFLFFAIIYQPWNYQEDSLILIISRKYKLITYISYYHTTPRFNSLGARLVSLITIFCI